MGRRSMLLGFVGLFVLLAWGLGSGGAAYPASDPNTDLALFNQVTGEWHLRQADGSDVSFFYGAPGDLPLLGDWDCDGVDTVAMFRPSNGFVYLRNSNTFGVAERDFFYGQGGDIPLAGDWNGDGCDTLAIYRASEGRVHIANVLGTVSAEYSFYYGVPGDRPFAGDFDADGVSEVGLYRDTTGFVYFRNSLTQGMADLSFFYGNPSDRIVAGDWDGDGDDTVGIFRPTERCFFLSNANRQAKADIEVYFGQSSWLPLAGEFTVGAVTTTTTATTSTTSTTVPGVLPPPVNTGPVVADGKAEITINNATHHGLTFEFQGPEPRVLSMAACPTCIDYLVTPFSCPAAATEQVLRLEPGQYTVTARTDDPGIRSFVGSWDLQADRGYFSCFYIKVSYR